MTAGLLLGSCVYAGREPETVAADPRANPGGAVPAEAEAPGAEAPTTPRALGDPPPGRGSEVAIVPAAGAPEAADPLDDDSAREGAASSPPIAQRLRGDALLGAGLVDGTGQRLGQVADMLIDPSTGHLVGAVVECPVGGPASDPGDSESTTHVVPPDRLGWSLDGERVEARLSAGDVRFLPEPGVPFDEREQTEIAGELTEVEPGPWGGLILKLRGEDNLRHGVWVEPACLVGGRVRGAAAEAVGEAPGPVLGVSGALTRDGIGKLLIASVVRRDDDELRLRDSSGRLLWRPLAAGLRSAARLVEREVVGSDGTLYPVAGWLVEREVPVVSHLLIDVDGIERELGWELARWNGEELASEHDAAWFRALPPARAATASP